MPAMALHANLDVEGPLDATFLENLDFVRRRSREWWPELAEGEVAPRSAPPAPARPDAGVFYTGGARLVVRSAAAPSDS